MKISIITITYHDGDKLLRTRQSLLQQRLPEGVELEHVIVVADEDFDETPYKGAVIVRREPRGCYDALNTGMEAASGDVIGLLHGNDHYADNDVLASVAEAFADDGVDIVYGDLYYTKKDGTGCSRYWSTAKFRPQLLHRGFMPPHPSMFLRRNVVENTGLYDTSYAVGSDFEYILRIFARRPAYGYRRIGRPLVAMSPGGLSCTWHSRLCVSIFERYRALKSITGRASYFRLLGRYYYHFFQ